MIKWLTLLMKPWMLEVKPL